MEKLAYLVIGASLAVVVMTFLPAVQTASSPNVPAMDMKMDMATMSAMGAAHQHPPLEVSTGVPSPSVTHLVFPDVMGGYNIQILPTNFTFTPAAINRVPQDNEGHAHIYVNGVKIARAYSGWYHLPGAFLKPGENDVKVTLNANNHSEWTVDGVPVSSTVKVFVPDPTQ